MLCFLCGRDWVFKEYLHQLWLQGVKGLNLLIDRVNCISGVGVPAVYRGTMLFLGAILSLLFIDHDEGQQHPGDNHLFSNISSWLGFADHKVM